jgi:hypothetical protein
MNPKRHHVVRTDDGRAVLPRLIALACNEARSRRSGSGMQSGSQVQSSPLTHLIDNRPRMRWASGVTGGIAPYLCLFCLLSKGGALNRT